MKTFLITCFGLFGAALLAAPAQAQHYSGAPANHSRHHDDLNHRGYHRDLNHREAHRSPLTYRQHGSLHDNLNHEAYHDRTEHRSAHRYGAYSPQRSYRGQSYYGGQSNYRGHSSYRPSGTGFYLSRPGFSLQIGR